MDNVPSVEVLYGAAGLYDEASDFRHGEELPFLDRIGERSIVAYLEDDIGVQLVRKRAMKVDDVGMVQLRVELQFSDKLATISQSCL